MHYFELCSGGQRVKTVLSNIISNNYGIFYDTERLINEWTGELASRRPSPLQGEIRGGGARESGVQGLEHTHIPASLMFSKGEYVY